MFELDPQMAAVLASMPDVAPLPAGDVAGRRALWEPIIGQANAAGGVPTDVTITDHHATGHDGADVLLRWYTKPDADPHPAAGSAVLYLHGGGMILGDIGMFDGPLARYVAATGVPILAAEYRLAPEHPYPANVEDCYAALGWLAGHAAELGVDPTRIAVMGDSAGGGLAVAVALLARDRAGPAIARQILLFPMLDDRTTTPDPALVPFALWTYDDNITGWSAVLGDGGADVSPYAAPARLDDAHGLPAAYIEVAQLDIFRDEDLTYAMTLSRAGIDVELHLHPGVPHEYDTIAPDIDVAHRAMADRIRVLTSI